MENFPLVSVIIPTHNRLDLVRRAVDSVLNQTYPNIEIIVVDDASELNVQNHLPKEPNIQVLRNEVNKGGCFSRNQGIKKAKGIYINFLDDDDIFFPEKISKQVECFKESADPKLGMVTSHALDERSGKLIRKFNRVQGNIYRDLLSYYAVSGIETMLFKAETIQKINGFDEQIPSSQEYDLLIRFSEYYTVDYVDEVLSKEFRSINQISLNFEKKMRGTKYLYQKHDSRFKEQGLLFWLKMKIKLRYLMFRFFVGKLFGEKWYRKLLIEK
ncbi:MAG: glycosyl transferase [Balneola sp.]|nr:glycosyl transferase [Balneola sp.]|tara:strand:+ start:30659 stop:31471 length:813 start_codon:yes stop_codon:yes gene_type:complete